MWLIERSLFRPKVGFEIARIRDLEAQKLAISFFWWVPFEDEHCCCSSTSSRYDEERLRKPVSTQIGFLMDDQPN